MAPPFISWPGADGLQTASMWAWWFPNRPAFLGPVPVRDDPRYLLPPPPCPEKEEYFGMYGVRPRQVPLLGQDLTKPSTPPPCSAGYIPLLDQGVIRCVPGSAPSSMMTSKAPGAPSGMLSVTPQPRTFPVTSGYGWIEE